MDGERVRAGQAAQAAAYLPTAVALCIILFAGLFADRQNRAMADLDERNAVQARVQTLAGEISERIGVGASAADRLAGALAAQPEGEPSALAALAGELLPGTRVAVVPRIGDPLLIRGDAGGLAAVLAGLPAGGGARLAETPEGAWLAVWSGAAAPGGSRAAVVMPVDAILAATGVDAGLGLDLALDDGGPAPVVTAPGVLDRYPVRVPVAVRGAELTLAGAPSGGWAKGSGVRWPIWTVTVLAAGLIVGPMLRTRRLIEERQRNILELRDREADLGRLSRRLGLALDASKVGVWDFNIDTDLLVWDERMDELYGYPPLAGRRHTYVDWKQRLHPEDLPRAEEEFREAIEETGRYVSDYRLLLPDGSVRHIRAIGAVYRDTDGSSRIVGVNWDVTADVLSNAELNDKRLEAEGVAVAKSQFLATMSHEIRTPMNGVIGMLDLILRTELDPVQRERAAIACDSARQLLDILNDVLDLSKLEANRISLDPAPVDVRRLTRDVAALMASGTADRDIDVIAETAPGVPAAVICDATRFRQVLMNLVGNAVKFTEAGSVVASLDYEPRRGRLEVAVRDTGVGIPEEAKRHLFQRFAQVDSSISRQRGGTGLGLAISRQLVELMGGEITVDSVAGLGSTFRFWIPAPAAEPAAEAAPLCLDAIGAAPVPALPPVRVLVAEDNQTNRQLLAAYLAMAGHSAHMVTNGHEAVAAVIEDEFDLVIMDIQMPIMDGITAAGRIRALAGPKASIPIIALTANAMEGDREFCIEAGMSEYVTKPVTLEALYGAMGRSLDYSSSVASTGVQPSPGSKLSMAAATASVSSPRSAS